MEMMTIPLSPDIAEPTSREDQHAAIVLKSRELFTHYGYSKTNIGDIAQECAMSPGNLYRYFKNKQAIGVAVVDNFMREEEMRTSAALVEASKEAEARLRAVITEGVMHTVEHLRQSPKIVELAEMICDCDEGVEMIQTHVMKRLSALQMIIADGVAAGEFHVVDTEAAARAVQMGTKFFHVPFAIARHGLDRVEEDLAVTLDLLCAGLRSRD
ncbi:MAG: TetR/AcrR family transcriptional regulator [Pseudomonadota bacterium]